MFTGIITDIGYIASVENRGDMHVKIHCGYDMSDINSGRVDIGASIACSGVCLTVVEKGNDDGQNWFSVDVSGETINCTADHWKVGAKLNLERSLKVGDELGGHIVSGHVDGVGTITHYENIGGSWALTILAPAEIAAYIAPKGSITINGISLTVNDVRDDEAGCHFMLNIIPHTANVTTLVNAKVGDSVNLEIDVLARYMKRILAIKPS